MAFRNCILPTSSNRFAQRNAQRSPRVATGDRNAQIPVYQISAPQPNFKAIRRSRTCGCALLGGHKCVKLNHPRGAIQWIAEIEIKQMPLRLPSLPKFNLTNWRSQASSRPMRFSGTNPDRKIIITSCPTISSTRRFVSFIAVSRRPNEFWRT